MTFSSLLRAVLFLLIFAPGLALAQPATAPHIPSAEQAFDRGLREFSTGNFSAAQASFERAAEAFGYNQRTTAAFVMAAKSRYAAGDIEGAISDFTTFIAAYPNSRYVNHARTVRRDAQTQLMNIPEPPEVFTLGIILPMASADEVFSQALFNGVRLAVDAHNEAHPDRPIRMVFRASGSDAGDAVGALVQAGADAIIGPLYSDEAGRAAAAAERLGVVMIAPLATDHYVSEGRRFVFQTNPTFDVRGRAMAQYTLEQGYGSVGSVAVSGSYAETMSNSFIAEARNRNALVAFTEILPTADSWFQMVERVTETRLRSADALYLPVSGATAEDQVLGALRSLQNLYPTGSGSPAIFGNAEWVAVEGTASASAASRFGVIVSSDIYPDERSEAYLDFVSRYRQLSGIRPDRLAFIGYDASTMLIAAIDSGLPLQHTLREASVFEGVAHRIHFKNSQVNQSLFFLRFGENGLERIR